MSKTAQSQSELLGRIAKDLFDVERIAEAIDIQRKKRPDVKNIYAPPRTPTEIILSKIWAETLNIEEIGIYDNFFDLGGYSILATQILSRVRNAFQIEIPISILFAGAFTVEELAKLIDVYQIEQASPDEFVAILREIEGLTDEEIKILLIEDN